MIKVVIYLILLRHALIPKQLVSFDYGEENDIYLFSMFYMEHKHESIAAANAFLEFIRSYYNYKEIHFDTLCDKLIGFMLSIPFLDHSELQCLDSYNPFKDYGDGDYCNKLLYGYFRSCGHIPYALEPDRDFLYVAFEKTHQKYFDWYNSINCKSLENLLCLYIEKLEQVSETDIEGDYSNNA